MKPIVLKTRKQEAQESVVEVLERALEKAKSGEIVEVMMQYRSFDGEYFLSSSHSMNTHETAGWLLDMACTRISNSNTD